MPTDTTTPPADDPKPAHSAHESARIDEDDDNIIVYPAPAAAKADLAEPAPDVIAEPEPAPPQPEPELEPAEESEPEPVPEPAEEAEPATKTEPGPPVIESVPPVAAARKPAPQGMRRIWLCADDYGISPKVSEAIRELLLRGRINATSVMVVAPSFNRNEAMQLAILKGGSPRIAIGLHVTLTAPFRPLTPGFAPLRKGTFMPLRAMLAFSLLRRLHPEKVAVEVGAQIKAFSEAFGRLPDFIDGHQHVHVFPQVREGVIAAVKSAAPHAWIRQCGSKLPLGALVFDRKGFLIDRLSRTLKRRAAKAGLATNPAFAGTYDFKKPGEYAEYFPGFLRGMPDGGVVMCHPGFVDEELKRLDPLTDLREKEYAFFMGADFPALLKGNGISIG